MAFIIVGPDHSPQEGKFERKDKSPRQMAEAGQHLEGTQRRKIQVVKCGQCDQRVVESGLGAGIGIMDASDHVCG